MPLVSTVSAEIRCKSGPMAGASMRHMLCMTNDADIYDDVGDVRRPFFKMADGAVHCGCVAGTNLRIGPLHNGSRSRLSPVTRLALLFTVCRRAAPIYSPCRPEPSACNHPPRGSAMSSTPPRKVLSQQLHSHHKMRYTSNRDVQRHPGDAKCVSEILGDKNKEIRVGTKFNMCWFLCLKYSTTHLQASVIPKFPRGDTHVKKGEEGDRRGRGKERGRLCHSCWVWTPLTSSDNKR